MAATRSKADPVYLTSAVCGTANGRTLPSLSAVPTLAGPTNSDWYAFIIAVILNNEK